VWHTVKAAVGYCDEVFFTVMVRRLREKQDVPPLSVATRSLFQAVKRDASKADVAEAAVTLVLSAWERCGSAVVEAIGRVLIQQIRYDNRFCRSCSSQIAEASKSPYCEHCEARDETDAEERKRDVLEGWQKMTPEQRADMKADIRDLEEESDEYSDRRDEELEELRQPAHQHSGSFSCRFPDG
jgi:hypothetical protein